MLAYDFHPTEGGIQTLMRDIVTSGVGVSWTVLTRRTQEESSADEALRVRRTTIRPQMRLVDRVWIRTRRSPITVPDLIAFQTEKKLLAVAREVRPHFLFADQCWTAVSVRRVARRLRCPWGLGVYGKELLGEAPQRDSLLAQADLVLACSNFTKKLAIERSAREDRTHVLWPAVDTTVFTPAQDRDVDRNRLGVSGYKVLLTVAHLVPRKGHETVLRAMQIVRHAWPNLLYLVVGRGPHESQLRSCAKEMGLAESVRFCGYVPADTLPDYYRVADIHVMPSLDNGDVEGFGISFIEAAACGTPSIGSRSGGIPEAISDGKTGYLVEPGDVAGLAKAIVLLLTDEGLRRATGTAARANAVANFSRRVFARSVTSAVQPLVGREPPRG